jgi:Na+/H+ antiporter NhaC
LDFGILAIVPPILTIILAIITKEVLMSLLIGVLSGCLILTQWNPVFALEKLTAITVSQLSDSSNICVVLIIFLLGGLIGLLTKSGGIEAFAEVISSKVKSRRGAMAVTWLLGLLFFFDDYFNALATGAIMRPVCDKHRISREKLSYCIDSTAVGVCLLAPVSSWVAFITSLIAGSFAAAGIQQDPFQAFLYSIPLNYYAWLSIIMVGMTIFFSLDFGPMAKAEKRTLDTGISFVSSFGGGDMTDELSQIRKAKGKVFDLIVPVLLLIVFTFGFMLFTGGFFDERNGLRLTDALRNMNGTLALVYAIFVTIIITTVIYKIKSLSSIKDSISAFVTGTKSMVFVVILLVFAWAIGGVCQDLKTGEYVAGVFNNTIPSFLVPALLFVITCAMAFSTGASWGIYAIMMPVAISLTTALHADVFTCIAAVIGGGGFGTHCSPLADSAILSSAGADIRHVDHIKTQIPYSLTCAAVATVTYILAGYIKNPVIPALVCIILFIAVVVAFGRLSGRRKRRTQDPARQR